MVKTHEQQKRVFLVFLSTKVKKNHRIQEKTASTRRGISVGVMKAGLIRNDKVLGSPQEHPTSP